MRDSQGTEDHSLVVRDDGSDKKRIQIDNARHTEHGTYGSGRLDPTHGPPPLLQKKKFEFSQVEAGANRLAGHAV